MSVKQLVIVLLLAPICIALATGQLSGVQWSLPNEQGTAQYYSTTLVTIMSLTTTTTSQTRTTTTTSQMQTTTTTSQMQTTTTTSQTQTTTSTTIVTVATSISTTTSPVTITKTTTSFLSFKPPSPPRCVIATAAYGSELAPEVVYMRYVRDELIGSTPPGRTFVAAFNTFYYSWSPAVAQWIAGNGLLRAVFRLLLLPLLGIMHVTALVFTAVACMTGRADVASVFAFLAAAIMTITVYVVLPIVGAAKSKQTIGRLNARFRA